MKENLKRTAVIYLLVAAFCIQFVLLVSVYAQVGDIRKQTNTGNQTYPGEVQALTEAVRALEKELDDKQFQIDCAEASMGAVAKILDQLNYEAILARPEQVDLWIQTCAQELKKE